MPHFLASIEIARPAALALFAVPLALWWLARRSVAPQREATATLALWRAVKPREPESERALRRRVPAWLAFAMSALACGVAALAGVRAGSPSDPVTWTAIVDRSPSMYLPLAPAATRTRIDAAVERARELIEAARADADEVEWNDGRERARGAFPSAWLVPPWPPRRAPEFSAFDRFAVVWVTDVAPRERPARAGVASSGAAAIPGVVAGRGTTGIEWDGERLVEREGALEPPRYALDVPESLARTLRPLVEAWAASREFAEVRPGDEVELAIGRLEGGEPIETDVERDGWSARVRAGSLAPSAAMDADPWLTARAAEGRGWTVVRRTLGRVETSIAELIEIRGDPAAFAVSWAELFDSAVAPQRGVVALEERALAGEAVSIAPAHPERGAADRGVWIDAVLALVAASLALAAVAKR